MSSILIARGQATISIHKDPYTITQSLGEYLLPTDAAGNILSSITLTSTISVMCNDIAFTEFTIGTIARPTGFASITVDNDKKCITYTIAAGTTTLADHGTIDIPISIVGIVYHLSFVWSKAKQGQPGVAGVDANLLDWVKEWNTGKTLIDSNTVITPKLFAGTKNSDGTISGVAIGSFTLSTKTASGTVAAETVNGVYGFREGHKTFYVDNGGNAQLGYGDQYVRYNATTGKVEFGSGVSLNWVGATYIDKDGIFTGTISADTVKTIALSASQITSGLISSDRIDVAALKASLLTAENIEALTLNVNKGKIGGWTVDSDSIYRGTKNNVSEAYTAALGSITIGSNGLRGNTWRLDASGAGAVAGGNIAWDALGNVTFASTVSALWTAPIGSLTTALGGSGYPKLTKITADGIYTGSITATQITAGIISADRIAAGSITASKLDAASIKSSIINTDYINGLICTFTKGKIGGWTIGASALTATHISLDSSNKCIAVYGANSGPTNGQRVQFYYNSDTDFGFYVTNSAGACVARLGSSNSIAGWTIDTASICKGNVSLGSDGSIINSTKWKLNNDGSGQIASGNIIWDAAGNLSFAPSVSILWTAPIDSITEALGGDDYPRLTELSAAGIYTGALTAAQVNAVAIDASSIKAGTLSADRIAAGSIDASKLNAASIRSDIVNTDYINGLTCRFTKGFIGGWYIGNNKIFAELVNESGSITEISLRSEMEYRTENWFSGNYPAAGLCMVWNNVYSTGHLSLGEVANIDGTNKSGYIGLQMMDWQGMEYFCLAMPCDYDGEFEPYNRIAGWGFDHERIWKNRIVLGSDGSITNTTKWQLNNDGSGLLASGNISWDTVGNVSFSEDVSLAWRSGIDALTAALGGESYPKLTHITAAGVYTGTVRAGQIAVDSTLIVGGSSYNGSISVRDANNNVKVTLDRTGITAVAGKIGGWALGTSSLTASAPSSGHRIVLSASGYIYHDNPNSGNDYWALKTDGSATFGCGTISFSSDGSGFVANKNMSWDAAGNITANNGTFNDVVINGTIRNAFILNDSTWYWDDEDDPQMNFKKHDHVVAIRGSFSEEIPLPWTLEHSGRRICLVNYRWGSNTTIGYMDIMAPSGMYFYEDGIAKSKIQFSRELVELLGYGDDTTFFGWIVVNRLDLMTTKKYGAEMKYLVQGTVTVSSATSISVKYKTFDGSTITVSRLAKGQYRVNMPSSWNLSGNYTVFLSGNYSTVDNTSIYATLKTTYSYYFDVYTQDDETRNEGSFNFLVVSTGDWK